MIRTMKNDKCPVVKAHDQECCSEKPDEHCVHPLYFDHDGAVFYNGVQQASAWACCKCEKFIKRN